VQMRNALFEARRVLLSGGGEAEALAAAKSHASFSGPMRTNLIAMLDHMGVQRLLGIGSCATLWQEDGHLVHFTSVLRYPTFVDGANYAGSPAPVADAGLMSQVSRWFAGEAAMLPGALYIPLGGLVAETIARVSAEAGIDKDRILSNLPHPSGANAERIAFFLGRKARGDLSSKVSPDRILGARATLEAQVSRLTADFAVRGMGR
jgi:hypothetical protein